MTALWRINLWVTLFFALLALLGTALLLRQGSADVQREMRAAEAMIEYLQVAAQRDPASLHGGLAGNLRHVRVTPVPLEGVVPPAAESALQQVPVPCVGMTISGRRPLCGGQSIARGAGWAVGWDAVWL